MLDFLRQNIGTIIVGLVLLAVVVIAVRRTYLTRKSGGCGCGCDGCASSGLCHPQGPTDKN